MLVAATSASYCVHKPYEFCESKFDAPKAAFPTRFWDFWQCQARPHPAAPGTPCFDTTPWRDVMTGNPSAPSFPKQQPLTATKRRDAQPRVSSPSLPPLGGVGEFPYSSQWGRYAAFASDAEDMRRTAQLLKPSTENWGEVGHIAAFETGDGRPFVINHGLLAFSRDAGTSLVNDPLGPLGGWQMPGPQFMFNQPRPGLAPPETPGDGAGSRKRGADPNPYMRAQSAHEADVADWWRFSRPEMVIEELSRDARWTVCLTPDCSSTRPPASFVQDGELATYFNFAPCGLSSSVHLWVDGQKRLTFVGVSSRTAWTDPRVVFAQCVDAACSSVTVRTLGATFRELPAVEHQCVGGHFGVGARIVVASDGNPSIMWRNKNNPSDIVYVHCRDAECKDIAPPQTFQLDAEKINPAIHPRAEGDEWLTAAQGGADANGWQHDFTDNGDVGRDGFPFPQRNQWQWSSSLFYEPALWWDLVASERGIWMVTLHQANRAHDDGATFMQVTLCDDTHCQTSGEQYPRPDVPDTSGSSGDGLRNTANIYSRESASYDYFYGADAKYDEGFADFKRSFWRNHGWSWSTNAASARDGKFAGAEDEWQSNPNNVLPPEQYTDDPFNYLGGGVKWAGTNGEDTRGRDLANVGSQWTELWGRSFKPTVGDVAWASRAFSAGLTGDGYPMWVGQAENGPESSIAWLVCSCRDGECREPECHVLANGDSIMDPAMRQCMTYREADLRTRSFGPNTFQGADHGLDILTDSAYQLDLSVLQPSEVTDPRWQRAAHHASRHRILNGASDGLPIIVQQISSFCLQLDGDGTADANAYSGWLGGADLRFQRPTLRIDAGDEGFPQLGQHGRQRKARYFARSVTNRRVLLQSAKSTYINCLDATCKQASVSALESPKVSSVSAELGYQQVDSTLVAPDNVLTIYAPDQTFHELTYSWMDPRASAASFGEVFTDDFGRGHSAFTVPGTYSRPMTEAASPTPITGQSALPMYAYARHVLGLTPTPRTAGWKTWLTNRWSSPNGSPCDDSQAGRMVSADGVVFLCTGLDLGDDQRYASSVVDGWTNYFEWQELGWGLRWRWLGDVHYGTDRPMAGLDSRVLATARPSASQDVIRRLSVVDEERGIFGLGADVGQAWNTANNFDFSSSAGSDFGWSARGVGNTPPYLADDPLPGSSVPVIDAVFVPPTPSNAMENVDNEFSQSGNQVAQCYADDVPRRIHNVQWYVIDGLTAGEYTLDIAQASSISNHTYAFMYPCNEVACAPGEIIAEGCSFKQSATFMVTQTHIDVGGGIFYLAIGNTSPQLPPFTSRGGFSGFSRSTGHRLSAVLGPSSSLSFNF